MKVNHDTLLETARIAKDVYDTNIDLSSTEYDINEQEIDGVNCQVLAIAGTNELIDWGKNLDLRSIAGIKRASFKASYDIHYHATSKGYFNSLPLVVIGHSKGGATAIAYNKMYGTDHTYAFCPARSLKDREVMDNLTVVIDPDDPVPMMGFITFKHPQSELVLLEDDHWFPSIGDHFMSHVIECLEDKKYTIT